MVLSAIDIYLVNFCSASCIVCCVFLALMRYSFSICPFPFNMRQTQRCRRRKQKTTTKMFMKMWRGNRMNRRYFICKTRLISLNFFKLYCGTDCLCPEIYVCISETTSQRLHFMRWTSIASAAMCKVHSVFSFFESKRVKCDFSKHRLCIECARTAHFRINRHASSRTTHTFRSSKLTAAHWYAVRARTYAIEKLYLCLYWHYLVDDYSFGQWSRDAMAAEWDGKRHIGGGCVDIKDRSVLHGQTLCRTVCNVHR